MKQKKRGSFIHKMYATFVGIILALMLISIFNSWLKEGGDIADMPEMFQESEYCHSNLDCPDNLICNYGTCVCFTDKHCTGSTKCDMRIGIC